MKKALVLLLALTLVSGFMFAEGGKITVSGNVQAQWGVDLDHATTGFKYVMDGVQLKLTPPTENTSVKATGDEGATTYGEISVGNLRVYAESAYGIGDYGAAPLQLKWDEVAAKLVFGALTVAIKNGASTDINYAGAKADAFWLSNAFDYAVYSGRYGADDSAQSGALANSWESWNQVQFDVPGPVWDYKFTYNYGLNIKYVVDKIVDIGADIASFKAWDDDTRFADGDQGDNAYTGRVTFSVTAVPNLTAKAGANIGYVDPSIADPVLGFDFGGQVGYAVKVGDDISITPQAAADVKIAGEDLAFFIAGGVNAALKGAKVVANVGMSNATVAATEVNSLAFTFTADAGSLVPNLTAKAAFEYQDPTLAAGTNETMAIFGELAYGIAVTEAAKVTPWAKVSFDNKDDTTKLYKDENDLYAKIGVDVSGLLKNTTFTAKWDSNDLINDAADATKLGEFVILAKVSF